MAITVPPARTTAEKLSQTFIAGEIISALKAVRLDSSSTAFLAEPSGTFEDAKVVGVAISTAPLGANVEVQTFGILEDAAFTFPTNAPLFLTSSGTITDVAETTGFSVQIGHSLGTGSIFINVGEPIQLP